MHEGEPILLDANRTPGMSPTLTQYMKDGARNLAEGLAGRNRSLTPVLAAKVKLRGQATQESLKASGSGFAD